MLGANGAGKSTLAEVDRGAWCRPQSGARVSFNGQDLLALPPHEIVEAGIALVPEGRGIFPELTVRENLELGAFARRARATESDNLARVRAAVPASRRTQARRSPHHERRRAADGRDRPRADVVAAPSAARTSHHSAFRRSVRRIVPGAHAVREAGVAILLVEQNAVQGLNIADRGYLIETGRIVGQGTAATPARRSGGPARLSGNWRGLRTSRRTRKRVFDRSTP
jgi:branched-chain amino acid transport system ATP-binding protein